ILRRQIAQSSAAPINKTDKSSISTREEPTPNQQTYLTKSDLDRVLAELKAGQNRASETPVFAFVLTPGSVRSTQTGQRLVVPSGSSAVKLELSITGDEKYRTFRAILRDA